MYSPPDAIEISGIKPIGKLFRFAWIGWAMLGVAVVTRVVLEMLGDGPRRRVQLNAEGVDQAWLQALTDNLVLPLLIIGVVGGIMALVMTAWWLYRAHRNVELLGLPTRFGAPLVAGGIFIPGLNLVWPFLGLQSVARAVRVPRAPLYVAWTLLLLETLMYLNRAYQVQMAYGKLGESLQTALVFNWLNTTTLGVAAGMLIYLAFRVTAKQDARLFYEPWTSERDAFDQLDIERSLRTAAENTPTWRRPPEAASLPGYVPAAPEPRVRSSSASAPPVAASRSGRPAPGGSGKPAGTRTTPKPPSRPPSPGN